MTFGNQAFILHDADTDS